MANFGSKYRYKRDYLENKGLLPFEAREIARNYDMPQIKSLPYLQSVIKSRQLFIINLRKRGYSDREIKYRVYTLYDKKDWLVEGRPDIWQMIRRYRKTAIDKDDYNPVKRKGTHHKSGSGISKGNLTEQRKRRKAKSALQKYDEGRGR